MYIQANVKSKVERILNETKAEYFVKQECDLMKKEKKQNSKIIDREV